MQIQDGVIVSSRLTLRYVGEVMADPYTYTIFWRSFYIAVAVTLLCIVLAYPIAYVYTLVGRLGRQQHVFPVARRQKSHQDRVDICQKPLHGCVL